MVLEKTLESPLDCKEIQPVHPKEISPGYSLEGLMLKLKLQYFGHLMRRVDSLEKREGLGAGGEGDNRGLDGWMSSPTRRTWVWVNSGSWWWTWRAGVLQFMGLQRVGHDLATELNWTDYKLCWRSFHVPFGHLFIFFGKMFIQVFCSFLIRLLFFFCCLDIKYDLQIFPPML